MMEEIADVISAIKNIIGEEKIHHGWDTCNLHSITSFNKYRKLWNQMINEYPSCIIQCDNEHQLQKVIHYCHENKIDVTVKGGGHNVAGQAIKTGTIMIDLKNFNKVRMLENKQVEVGGGCVWRDVDAITKLYSEEGRRKSRFVPAGLISHTGVGGLTLGGGIGWLSRKYGLTLDSLKQAEIILPTGELKIVNENENPDLFWGIRGGGGNFGIITKFTFQTHYIPEAFYCSAVYSVEKFDFDSEILLNFLQQYFDNTKNSVKERTQYLFINQTIFNIITIILPSNKLNKNNEKIKKLDKKLINDTLYELNHYPLSVDFLNKKIQPIASINQMYDEHNQGNAVYWSQSTLFAPESEKESENFIKIAKTLLKIVKESKSIAESTVVEIVQIGGKINEIPKESTSFFNRGYLYEVHGIVVLSQNESNWEKPIGWARSMNNMMQELKKEAPNFFSGYINTDNQLYFSSDAEANRIKELYGNNYEKIQQLKNKYDPKNFFHYNRNIKPTAGEDIQYKKFYYGTDLKNLLFTKYDFTHEGIACDTCLTITKGVRYHCLHCDAGYDCCQFCFVNCDHKLKFPQHSFVSIIKPVSYSVCLRLSSKLFDQPLIEDCHDKQYSKIECSDCKTNIQKDYFKCAMCDSFPLCSACFAFNTHSILHLFIFIPAGMQVRREFENRVILKETDFYPSSKFTKKKIDQSQATISFEHLIEQKENLRKVEQSDISVRQLFSFSKEIKSKNGVNVAGKNIVVTLSNILLHYNDLPFISRITDVASKTIETFSFFQIYQKSIAFSQELTRIVTSHHLQVLSSDQKLENKEKFIGICGENKLEWFLSDFGTVFSWYTSVPINYNISFQTFLEIVNEMNLSVLIISKYYFTKFIEEIEKNLKEMDEIWPETLSTIIIMDEFLSDEIQHKFTALASKNKRNHKIDLIYFSKMIENANVIDNTVLIPDEPLNNANQKIFTLFFTSGSTGKPKGVARTYSDWEKMLIYFLQADMSQSNLSTVSYSPLAHVMDRLTCWLTMFRGGLINLFDLPTTGSELTKLFKYMQIYDSITLFYGSPAVYNFIYKQFNNELQSKLHPAPASPEEASKIRKEVLRLVKKDYLGDKIEQIVTGGGLTDGTVIAFLKELYDDAVADGYGTTETGPVMENNKLLPGVEIKLKDIPDLNYFYSDKPFPRGELLVRTTTMFAN